VIVGHGTSLLRWRSGGFKHPHDMPPFRFPPSPTFGDRSFINAAPSNFARNCVLVLGKIDDELSTIALNSFQRGRLTASARMAGTSGFALKHGMSRIEQRRGEQNKEIAMMFGQVNARDATFTQTHEVSSYRS
ncbi:hypothetical protein ABIB85_008367, partial [Bradyrhizobium sp. JR1.5]|uniref:hypothetical protein n=2 Tax=unclassified Bradyrhizobium TaxID=2631580 RepID=UPI003394A867